MITVRFALIGDLYSGCWCLRFALSEPLNEPKHDRVIPLCPIKSPLELIQFLVSWTIYEPVSMGNPVISVIPIARKASMLWQPLMSRRRWTRGEATPWTNCASVPRWMGWGRPWWSRCTQDLEMSCPVSRGTQVKLGENHHDSRVGNHFFLGACNLVAGLEFSTSLILHKTAQEIWAQVRFFFWNRSLVATVTRGSTHLICPCVGYGSMRKSTYTCGVWSFFFGQVKPDIFAAWLDPTRFLNSEFFSRYIIFRSYLS